MGDNVIDRSIDGLMPSSRLFYENTLLKTVLSIVYAGFAIMYLGFVGHVGGESNASSILKDRTATKNSDNLKDAYNSLASGYGMCS
jgi:hypothetical protein